MSRFYLSSLSNLENLIVCGKRFCREGLPGQPHPPRFFLWQKQRYPTWERMEIEVTDSVTACMEEWRRRKDGNLIMILHEKSKIAMVFVPRSASLLLSGSAGDSPSPGLYEVLTFYHYFKLWSRRANTTSSCATARRAYLKGIGRLLGELETRFGYPGWRTIQRRTGFFHIETGAPLHRLLRDVSSDDRRWKDRGKLGPSDVVGIIETIRKEEGR